MAAILFISPLMSCATTKVDTATVIVPNINFPIFPDLVGATETEDGVLVSSEWIVSLARYRILIEEAEKNYCEIKSLYEKGSN